MRDIGTGTEKGTGTTEKGELARGPAPSIPLVPQGHLPAANGAHLPLEGRVKLLGVQTGHYVVCFPWLLAVDSPWLTWQPLQLVS